MKNFWKKYKEKGLRIAMPLVGAVALIWFLIRVIPKPSRASYPCMKAAFPLAASFVTFVSGLALWKVLSAFFHKPGVSRALGGIFLSLGLIGGIAYVSSSDLGSQNQNMVYEPNAPSGESKGIFPGRVVWMHDPDSTNEAAQWEDLPNRANEDAWFLDKNNNQQSIDRMLSEGLKEISGTETDSSAWSSIFRYYNQERGKGDRGYQPGEIVFIKLNITSSWNIDKDRNILKNNYYGISETSPHLVLALLHQLVDQAGVPQELIYIGDPMKAIYNHLYEKWNTEFPDVHYLDPYASTHGREKVTFSGQDLIKYSDRGEVLRSGRWDNAKAGTPIYGDKLATIIEDCDYMLNLPAMKAHQRAGITMFAKNHFGSVSRQNALHMHAGLVNVGSAMRNSYGQYRIQTDLMGHELLGGKNLLYIMDALWASDYEVDQPDKFMSPPFNNDWTSSLLISQDPVAIESVGFDILRTEFTEERYPRAYSDKDITSYPNYGAVDDYLHQAADSSTWPEGIIYDPEADGTPIESLGVHEHWNNGELRQYSRNLGKDQGIELLYFPM